MPKISGYDPIASIDGAADLIPIVDVDDLTMGAGGTTKTVKPNELGGSVRTTVTVVTASIANLAEATGVITVSKSFIINKVTVDKEARVRLYPTAAFRTADAMRGIGTDPSGEHGVLLDIVHVASYLAFSLSPPALGYNDDGPITNTIYYAIQNRSGSTGTITLTLDVTKLVS